MKSPNPFIPRRSTWQAPPGRRDKAPVVFLHDVRPLAIPANDRMAAGRRRDAFRAGLLGVLKLLIGPVRWHARVRDARRAAAAMAGMSAAMQADIGLKPDMRVIPRRRGG